MIDMWLSARLAATLHKGIRRNPQLVKAKDVIKMLTCDAAKGLGLGESLGSLEVGKEADMLLLNCQQAHLKPMFDVYSHLAYAFGRHDVESTFVAGKCVMDKGKVLNLNETEIFSKVDALAEDIKATMKHNDLTKP
ncbi:MAG: amidohydrolase family protein [Deinococcales bacterium]